MFFTALANVSLTTGALGSVFGADVVVVGISLAFEAFVEVSIDGGAGANS